MGMLFTKTATDLKDRSARGHSPNKEAFHCCPLSVYGLLILALFHDEKEKRTMHRCQPVISLHWP
jgi:hypothetical protein